jgi:hypothetical protein
MTKRGMVSASMHVFRWELLLTLPKERLQVIRSFEAELVDMISPSHPELTFLKTELSYERAKYLPCSGDIAKEVDHGLDFVQQWAALVGVSNIEKLPRRLNFQLKKLFLEPDNHFKLQHALELFDIMAQNRNGLTNDCLSLASSLCHDLAEQEISKPRWVQFHEIQQKLEAYYQHGEGNFLDIITYKNATLQVSANNVVDARKSLEWIDDVISEHPELTSPAHLSLLYRSRYVLSTTLGDQTRRNQSIQSMKDLIPLLPTGGEPAFIGLKPKSPNFPEDDEIEALDKRYILDFFNTTYSPVLSKVRVMCLIFDFAVEGLQEGTLTPHELHGLLNCECDLKENHFPRHQALIRERKTQDPLQLFDQLFMTDVCRGLAEWNLEIQAGIEYRYRTLLTWLSRPAKVSKNRRWLLLLEARDSRRTSLMEKQLECMNGGPLAISSRLVIEELEYCLRLYAQMPLAIKELLPTYQNTMEGLLATAHQHEFRLTHDNETLAKSEVYRAKTEEVYRRGNSTMSLTFKLRSLAENNLLKIWRLCQEGGNSLRNATQVEELCTKSLEALQEACSLTTDLIIESSWAQGLQSIAERSEIMDARGIRYTAELAVRCHQIRFCNTTLSQSHLLPSFDRMFDMWEWVQRSKAHVLALAMGTNRTVPASLLSQIRASPPSDVLYNRFLDIQKGILSAETSSRFYLRRELDQHICEMRKVPLLKRVFDLKEGTPLSLSEMREIAVNAGSPVVFVDWFQLDQWTPYLPLLLLFTIRIDPESQTSSHGAEAHFDYVSLVPGTLESWINITLNTEYVCFNAAKRFSRRRFAKEFSGLIEPLKTRSQPGDVLVLCPTQNLHRIPLHALDLEVEVDGEITKTPLIHRNPIVYSYSHSLLRTCFSDSLSARESAVVSQPVFLHGIHSANLFTQTGLNFKAGRDCINELSQQYSGCALTDDFSKKENLIRLLPSSTILHLHTHCNWNDGNPLAHHVELPDGPNKVSRFTAAEVFDVHLQPGSHVNLIACGGGRTQSDRSDEVMGLTPALMYAGASSTLSTLWPILDGDGVAFSKNFFASLNSCVGKNDKMGIGKTFDLARAVQKATIAIDPEFDRLSSAAYVLHGYWMLPWKN